MQDLQGRTAVVIGGGSGIGRGIALALGGDGMNVVVADIEREPAAAVANEIEHLGAKAVAVECDVTREESLAEAARSADAAFGAVHVLSNNAGVILTPSPLEDASIPDWEWVFSVNFFGIVKSVNAFLPALRAHREPAHIVNTASMAGIVTIPGGCKNCSGHSSITSLTIATGQTMMACAYCLTLPSENPEDPEGVTVVIDDVGDGSFERMLKEQGLETATSTICSENDQEEEEKISSGAALRSLSRRV